MDKGENKQRLLCLFSGRNISNGQVPGMQFYLLVNWRSYTPFDRICWLWKEYNKVCLYLYEQLPQNRKMVLPCADFWGDPEKSSENIFRFLDLPMVPLKEVRKLMKVPVYDQMIGAFPKTIGMDVDADQVAGIHCR